MNNSNESIFISYSWNDNNTSQWINNLVNNLRREGYHATFDRNILDTTTVHLQHMMIDNMKNSDLIILVIDELYAKKADEFRGGVGFENQLILDYLQSNIEKLIILIRQPNKSNKEIPFHLKGFNYIDFSDDENYKESFEQLIRRIQKVPEYDIAPIGVKRIRHSKSTDTGSEDVVKFATSKIFKPTDLEKEKFMYESYKSIISILNSNFSELKENDSRIEIKINNINNYKIYYQFYINGNNRINLKIWNGSFIMTSSKNSIFWTIGNYIDIDNDNSHNGSVTVEVDNNELRLSGWLLYNQSGSLSAVNIAEHIFNQVIQYLKS